MKITITQVFRLILEDCDELFPSQLKAKREDHSALSPPFQNRTKQKSVNTVRGVEHSDEHYGLGVQISTLSLTDFGQVMQLPSASVFSPLKWDIDPIELWWGLICKRRLAPSKQSNSK